MTQENGAYPSRDGSKHPRQRRLYPFTETVPIYTTGCATSGSMSIDWRVTTYKPNPFHGIDRLIFAVDEWQHRMAGRLPTWPSLAWSKAWRPFCNWWDRRLGWEGE